MATCRAGMIPIMHLIYTCSNITKLVLYSHAYDNCNWVLSKTQSLVNYNLAYESQLHQDFDLGLVFISHVFITKEYFDNTLN